MWTTISQTPCLRVSHSSHRLQKTRRCSCDWAVCNTAHQQCKLQPVQCCYDGVRDGAGWSQCAGTCHKGIFLMFLAIFSLFSIFTILSILSIFSLFSPSSISSLSLLLLSISPHLAVPLPPSLSLTLTLSLTLSLSPSPSSFSLSLSPPSLLSLITYKIIRFCHH
jgi:hypothetical protein